MCTHLFVFQKFPSKRTEDEKDSGESIKLTYVVVVQDSGEAYVFTELTRTFQLKGIFTFCPYNLSLIDIRILRCAFIRREASLLLAGF